MSLLGPTIWVPGQADLTPPGLPYVEGPKRLVEGP